MKVPPAIELKTMFNRAPALNTIRPITIPVGVASAKMKRSQKAVFGSSAKDLDRLIPY
jgi:hypothetical protein